MRALLNDLSLACRHQLVELLEEATPVGTWDWNIVDNTFFWSPRQFAHFGLQPLPTGEIQYETWLEAVHGDDREKVQAAIADTMAADKKLNIIFRVLWREAYLPGKVSVHWLKVCGRLIRSADGVPLRMVGTSRDVTELEQAVAQAKTNRDSRLADRFGGPSRFDVYFESSENCLFQLKVEPDGRFTYQAINPMGLLFINRTMAAAHGLTPTDVLGDYNGGQMIAALEEVLKTGLPVSYEPTFIYDGRTVFYHATYMPIRNEQGRITAILGRARDVTQQRQIQAALIQAQKMEALGQLAAGISHDFNNLLASLRGCFNRLSRIDLPAHGEHVIELGSNALQQGEALTRQLLTFARQQELTTTGIGLNACIKQCLGLVRSAVPEASVTANLNDVECEVMAGDGLIEACMLNLCINARDAAGKGCEITIETARVDRDAPLPDGLAPGNYVSVSVRDNGPGMPASTLSKAFDPFFTTKPVGKGTGLGLSMVYGTLRSLGGAVSIASAEGKGTTVTMYLRANSSALHRS